MGRSGAESPPSTHEVLSSERLSLIRDDKAPLNRN